jgi:hypothetical protein
MVTKEQLEYWYRLQEEEKANLPYGAFIGGGPYYCQNHHEPFATVALILMHLMFCWECEHPLDGKRHWTFTTKDGLLCESNKGEE